MKKKGLFKSYEAVSTDVKYGEKPKAITDEETRGLLRECGLELQENEVQGPGMEARSLGRGNGNNQGIVFNQSANVAGAGNGEAAKAAKEWKEKALIVHSLKSGSVIAKLLIKRQAACCVSRN